MTIAVRLCIAAGVAAGICHAEGPNLPATQMPEWATPEWVYDAAGIVAGETVPRCDECDRWVACTAIGDVAKRGYHPWRLRPGRWHGWRRPGERHLEAVMAALEGRCDAAPECAYLGSLSDYTGNWRFGLASERQVLVIGNRFGAISCVLE